MGLSLQARAPLSCSRHAPRSSAMRRSTSARADASCNCRSSSHTRERRDARSAEASTARDLAATDRQRCSVTPNLVVRSWQSSLVTSATARPVRAHLWRAPLSRSRASVVPRCLSCHASSASRNDSRSTASAAQPAAMALRQRRASVARPCGEIVPSERGGSGGGLLRSAPFSMRPSDHHTPPSRQRAAPLPE